MTHDTEVTNAKKGGYKVLLVDDDDFLISMYTQKFEHEGDEVQSASSTQEALSILRGGYQPDVIAFDVVMPQQNGFDLVQAIKSENLLGHAHLVALTNQWENENRTKAEELGVNAYIIKAESVPSDIVEKVHKVLSSAVPPIIKA